MTSIKEGTLLWEPTEESKQNSHLYHYMNWLKKNKNIHVKDYNELWTWSVTEIESFWESLWEYFDIKAEQSYETVLSSHTMPGARWFPEATLNYTEHIFRNYSDEKSAIIHASEMRETSEVSWKQLYEDTASFQKTLQKLGVTKGDRVAAYVGNIYETIVAFLATASIGAVWSSASPDFGTQSVIDRFKQIEPKVMITIDGYQYNGKPFDRTDVVKNIQAHLPTLEATIVIPFLHKNPDLQAFKNGMLYKDAVQYTDATLTYEHVSCNDPLWVLFSSGTTGEPKPIVQSQGGILLEHLKTVTLHQDLDENDRFFWYTTTGWMMWNIVVSGLLARSTIILYDGSPVYPNEEKMWQFAEETKMTVFGTSASYLVSCMKGNLSPGKDFDLRYLKSISSTGSPLPPEAYQWCYDYVKRDLWIASISGGTDMCTAFILGAPILPVHAGELQCRGLGAKIESFSDDARSLVNEIGELVITEPMPSMPIYFLNDDDGSRLHESYFDMFPGVWRHGDFLKVTERGSCVIYGRSDATINRGGIRIGTSEIYRAVDHIDDIVDSLIVEIPVEDNESIVPLFVIMEEGTTLTDEVKNNITQQIRVHCSPRHAPTHIYEVDDLPLTLNGKKLEVPIKRILMGDPVGNVVNRDSLANPDALDFFITFAKSLS